MKRAIIRRSVVFSWLVAAMVLAGCGKESTSSKGGDGEVGRSVNYFPLYVGYDVQYRVMTLAGDSIGTTRFSVINTFDAQDFSGFVAIDSTSERIDTLWIFEAADTVFWVPPRWAYRDRRPIVTNHTQTDFSWVFYVVGTPGDNGRYAVVFHQRPEPEIALTRRGGLFTDCGRTDLLAIYEQSGDTVVLGSEFFAPEIGRVISSFRPFVDSENLGREIIR